MDMANNTDTHRSNKSHVVGAWLGVLAGLCGIIVSLFWIVNQVRMSSGTPLSIVLSLYGLSHYGRGFLFLGLHLAFFTAVTLSGLRTLVAKPLDTPWLRLLVAFSLVYIGLSLLPFSTVAYTMLPAALGSLISNVLLLRRK